MLNRQGVGMSRIAYKRKVYASVNLMIALCIHLLLAVPCFADTIDIHRIIESETVFFHEFGYQFSTDETIAWYGRQTGLRTTAGSISSNRFYFDLESKIHYEPISWLMLTYRFHKKESFTDDFYSNRLDLTIKYQNWFFGPTGMSESKKEYTEIGLICGYRRSPDRWLTMRCLWKDALFNDKTSSNSEYIEQPVNLELEGNYSDENWRILGYCNYGFRWTLKEKKQEQHQRERRGYGMVSYHFADTRAVILEYRHQHLLDFLEPENRQVERTRLEIHRVTASYQSLLSAHLKTTIGVNWIDVNGSSTELDRTVMPYRFEDDYFDWDQSFARFDRMDLSGFAELTFSRSDMHHWFGRLHIGFVDSVTDPARLVDTLDNELTGKLTLEYTWRINPESSMTIGVTVKADEKVEFGGGNFRLML